MSRNQSPTRNAGKYGTFGYRNEHIVDQSLFNEVISYSSITQINRESDIQIKKITLKNGASVTYMDLKNIYDLQYENQKSIRRLNEQVCESKCPSCHALNNMLKQCLKFIRNYQLQVYQPYQITQKKIEQLRKKYDELGTNQFVSLFSNSLKLLAKRFELLIGNSKIIMEQKQDRMQLLRQMMISQREIEIKGLNEAFLRQKERILTQQIHKNNEYESLLQNQRKDNEEKIRELQQRNKINILQIQQKNRKQISNINQKHMLELAKVQQKYLKQLQSLQNNIKQLNEAELARQEQALHNKIKQLQKQIQMIQIEKEVYKESNDQLNKAVMELKVKLRVGMRSAVIDRSVS